MPGPSGWIFRRFRVGQTPADQGGRDKILLLMDDTHRALAVWGGSLKLHTPRKMVCHAHGIIQVEALGRCRCSDTPTVPYCIVY